jgi:lipid II isoglutaminyl synthase (glutamine-hydrolysing)
MGESMRGHRISVVHLYPDAMDLYGDTGNVSAIVRRCEWRDIEVAVTAVTLEGGEVPADTDLLLIGGGQDTAQALVAEDLERHASRIRDLVEEGAAALAVCGGFQLFGSSYETVAGQTLPGIGIFDARTTSNSERLIGNVVIKTVPQAADTMAVPVGTQLVGFENHAGRTHLGLHARPLGRIVHGAGNTGDATVEGAVYRNAIGTYLHGPLLPKNPHLTDALISAALRHRYGTVGPLEPLDDTVELDAHGAAVRRGSGTVAARR